MKKIFTISLVAMFSLTTVWLNAQVTRMAFVEEATQASCGPCAAANPGIQALMNSNSESAIFLAYQVWWPGFDQMYLDNPSEVDVRVGDYYGYEFAPQVVLQGGFVGTGGGSDELTQAELNAVSSQESEFELTVSGSVENGILTVTGTVNQVVDATGDFKLRLMLAEELITYDDAPGGTNGEEEYHHVFKSFIGGPEGISLVEFGTTGDSFTFSETLDISSLTIYHFDGLEVMAIVQNDDTKFVNQAAKDHTIEVVSNFENSASAVQINGLPNAVCMGEQTLSPVFKLSNMGNTDLTSATITYNINGGADQVYNWTGTLSTFASEDVTLDPYTFVGGITNTVNVTISMPNGVVDDNAADDDTVSANIGVAPDAGSTANVTIVADNYGDEIYWEIRNSMGEVIATGGNPNVGIDNVATGNFPPPPSSESYANNSTNEIAVPLPADDCYTFHITDYYGDGILDPGYYSVSDADGNVIIAEDDLIGEEINDFSGIATGIEEFSNIQNLSIYPNPVQDIANVRFDFIDNSDVTIEIVDVTGKVVYNKVLGAMNAGEQNIQIDTDLLGSGIYLFNIYSGSDVRSERVSIIK